MNDNQSQTPAEPPIPTNQMAQEQLNSLTPEHYRYLKEQFDIFKNELVLKRAAVAKQITQETPLVGQLLMTSYINALLGECRQLCVILGGEKYMYDMFLFTVLGQERIAGAKEAIQEIDKQTPMGTFG